MLNENPKPELWEKEGVDVPDMEDYGDGTPYPFATAVIHAGDLRCCVPTEMMFPRVPFMFPRVSPWSMPVLELELSTAVWARSALEVISWSPGVDGESLVGIDGALGKHYFSWDATPQVGLAFIASCERC